MLDLVFNPITRDMPLTANGDFETTSDPSTQNGAIILESRTAVLANPAVGIGFNSQVLGDDVANATFELNRCVGQIRADGGAADWRSIPPPPNIQFDFNLSVKYQK